MVCALLKGCKENFTRMIAVYSHSSLAGPRPARHIENSEHIMPNIAAMDNGTMVETFKFLNYYQLATSSHVSKRFWNLIRTHRHKLALLDVKEIFMNSYVGNQDTAIIEMFNEELSPEEYNEWIVRNGYSKQIPLEGQIAGKESTENDRAMYVIRAHVYQGGNNCHNVTTNVFYAHAELKDENWPLFQHFIRLLMDPFIYIRTLTLNPQKDVLSLLTGAMKPDRDRLQCAQLNFHFKRNAQEFIVWIKDHMRCDEMLLDGYFDSNYDEEFLDLLMTGGLCTSAINVKYYDLSKVIVDLVQKPKFGTVPAQQEQCLLSRLRAFQQYLTRPDPMWSGRQKFMHLKRRDEYQIVESIQGYVELRAVIEEFKRNFAEFIAEEGQYVVIGFINNDIEKKLTLNVENFRFGHGSFSTKITNL
ncbi:hypothetical protein Ddc_21613 [Ditylenchus destructor]|nr:hypothetical protein Ddc_21613 [Ditylenchus destructor]